MERITRVYDTGKIKVEALRGIDLKVRKGQLAAITGPSGSGKSTLMNIIGCLDTPDAGRYTLGGKLVSGLSLDQLSDVRTHKIGFVFQNFNLLPYLTAYGNVEMPMIFAGRKEKERRVAGMHLLEQVGMADRARHRPNELSGGQQQRVAIARALANEPDIILADEPTGNLDLHTGEAIIRLIGNMQRELGITVVSATHDMKMLSASDQVVWIRDGAIARVARKGEVDIEVGTINGMTLA